MPQVGPLEILVVAAIALIVFGPQKLPEMARNIGRFMTEIRRMASEVRSEFEAGLDDPVEDETDVPSPAPDDAPGDAEAEADEEPPVRATAED